MSRVGKSPIVLPAGVKLAVSGRQVDVRGPKGGLSLQCGEGVSLSLAENTVTVARVDDSPSMRALHGTTRALVNNMVLGVSAGWHKVLQIEGVGYRSELQGKTLVIVGLGKIGGRLAQIAKAFDMRVIGVRRDPAGGKGAADEVHALAALPGLLPAADFVALTCPLTPETTNLIDAAALAAMRPSAYLVNCARGRVVDEPALVAALQAGTIAGAGIDVTWEEPLPSESPLWDAPNAFITPHTAGETRRYEDNVLDILMENLARQWRGDAALLNQVV